MVGGGETKWYYLVVNILDSGKPEGHEIRFLGIIKTVTKAIANYRGII